MTTKKSPHICLEFLKDKSKSSLFLPIHVYLDDWLRAVKRTTSANQSLSWELNHWVGPNMSLFFIKSPDKIPKRRRKIQLKATKNSINLLRIVFFLVILGGVTDSSLRRVKSFNIISNSMRNELERIRFGNGSVVNLQRVKALIKS